MKFHTIKEPIAPLPSLAPQRKLLEEILRRKQVAMEKLTLEQIADAIIKALPDFTKYISYDGHGQQMVYIPGQEAHRLRTRLTKLEEDLKPVMGYMAVMRHGASPGPPTDKIITPFFEKHPNLDPGF